MKLKLKKHIHPVIMVIHTRIYTDEQKSKG